MSKDGVWTGEVGDTAWLCPYCMLAAGLWMDHPSYKKHMDEKHPNPTGGQSLCVQSIDTDNKTITFRGVQEEV